MAKNKKPTDDDLSQDVVLPVTDDFVVEEVNFSSDEDLASEAPLSNEVSYFNMGEIKTDEDKDKADEEFEEAAKKLKKPANEEESEDDMVEWADEDVNLSDEDVFLDQEDFDSDNYGYEDDKDF